MVLNGSGDASISETFFAFFCVSLAAFIMRFFSLWSLPRSFLMTSLAVSHSHLRACVSRDLLYAHLELLLVGLGAASGRLIRLWYDRPYVIYLSRQQRAKLVVPSKVSGREVGMFHRTNKCGYDRLSGEKTALNATKKLVAVLKTPKN